MSLADRAEAGPPNAPKKARILTLDIERLQGTARVWEQGKQYVGHRQFETEPRTIGVALKWLGEPAMWVDERRGRDHMLRVTHEAMSRADIWVGYNNQSFDQKHLAWDFARAGLPKLKPAKTIDLYRVVRANFQPLSKSLDHVARALGLGGKVETPSGLWDRCAAGDVEAWQIMGQYARGDVRLTEALYLRLLPYVSGTANVALMAGEDRGCPNCGGTELDPAGSTFTPVTQYALYSCASCGSWVRTNYIKGRATIRAAR